MDNNTKNKLLSGMLWSSADKLITQIGYLLVTLFIARVIGPDAFGLIGMLSIFILLSESIINNGFSQALIQRSHNATENDYSTIFYINIIWGVFIYTILFFSAPLIADFYHKVELINISRVLFLVIIINSFSVVIRAKLIIKVDFKSQAISNVIATLLGSILSIYLVFNNYSYWAFVFLILSKAIFTNIFLYFFSRWVPQLIFSKKSFKELFRFGSNLMIAGFFATLVNNLYIVLIGRYFNVSNVGYFSQATNLTNFLSQFISSTLQGVTYPILTSIKEQRDKLISLYIQLLSVTMLISFPIFSGFAAISDTFTVAFLGEEWLPAVPIIQILCFARMITPISAINMNILNAVGRSDLFLKTDLSKLPLILISIFFAIPYGMKGMAIAILTTTLISFFINAYYPKKLFNFGALDQLIISKKYILSSAIMYVSIFFISLSNPWLELLIKITIGMIVYILLLLLFKDRILITIMNTVKNKFS
ncbi:TPA: lipopolysaccharide biosynthesis protein [Providencia rettgeri]|uniref:lipopolysaccharide biosynthesis protein n=1 Tax=Providencia sp. PROV141 TaxID=2949851 RepID=UPI001B979F6A|nr:lipopolysaccharide biosynthesis protein [Providencia sp. PROV141]HBC7429885.1 lipopolysaccharide biosynthesis protein [Providencia rettgeri]